MKDDWKSYDPLLPLKRDLAKETPKRLDLFPGQITFAITGSQYEILMAWKGEIKKKHGEYGHFEYVFTPFGMGTGIKVKSVLTGKTLDISEVEKL